MAYKLRTYMKVHNGGKERGKEGERKGEGGQREGKREGEAERDKRQGDRQTLGKQTTVYFLNNIH